MTVRSSAYIPGLCPYIIHRNVSFNYVII